MGEILRIENEVIFPGRRNNQCWFAPRMAVVPAATRGAAPEVHVAVIQLASNDLGPIHWTRTIDLGKTWTPPMESLNLTGIPLEDDVFEKPEVWPYYHHATRTLLGLGGTGFVRDADDDPERKKEQRVHDRMGDMAYARWNPARGDFDPWRRSTILKSGKDVLFSCFYCSQPHERDDGTWVFPVVLANPGIATKVGSMTLSFDGEEFSNLKVGNFIGFDRADIPEGVHEPSLIFFDGRYHMTIRSECGDHRMYQAISDDGLNWCEFRRWCWDDGTEIETENTQQHWLSHGNALFLIYTRKSELSKGVFRHRAPLFIARVDPGTLRLIRDSEQIVFPENRARLCNFSVSNVTANESWVVCGEWIELMIPRYQKGMRFWSDTAPVYNYIQYVGNLLLGRIYFTS